ncbi:hypothetical protein H4R33_002949 [Dimargaris cristalligena]|nr:hypothetical protein H4R33_002949 [Dimargaris cristalligena]
MQLPSLTLVAVTAAAAIAFATAAVLPTAAMDKVASSPPENLAHASNGAQDNPVNRDDDDIPYTCECGLKFYNRMQYNACYHSH